MAKAKAVAKKTMKKVSTKKPAKAVEAKETPQGEVIGSLTVNYYKNGFNIAISQCSPKMLMLAVEELMVKYIMGQGSN